MRVLTRARRHGTRWGALLQVRPCRTSSNLSLASTIEIPAPIDGYVSAAPRVATDPRLKANRADHHGDLAAW